MKLLLLILTIAVGYALNGQDSLSIKHLAELKENARKFDSLLRTRGDSLPLSRIFGPDSIAVKVIERPITIKDTTYYKLLVYNMGGKEVVWAKCVCAKKHKKGDIILVAKKDLIFE